jgi:hypothetical protein
MGWMIRFQLPAERLVFPLLPNPHQLLLSNHHHMVWTLCFFHSHGVVFNAERGPLNLSQSTNACSSVQGHGTPCTLYPPLPRPEADHTLKLRSGTHCLIPVSLYAFRIWYPGTGTYSHLHWNTPELWTLTAPGTVEVATVWQSSCLHLCNTRNSQWRLWRQFLQSCASKMGGKHVPLERR